MISSIPVWQLWFLCTPLFAHLMMALLLCRNKRRTQRLAPAGDFAEPPSVMVLIPARNEAANIEGCVASVLAQRYSRLAVRVIDDHSTDGTGDLVRALCVDEPRLAVIEAPTLPPGWLGKAHALFAGTRGVGADYLLFLDADMRLREDAVGRAVATAQALGTGLLTVVPQLLAGSFWERAVQPVVATLLFSLLDPVRVVDPHSSFASANGPFLLFSRDAYERIGGHQAVAAEVVEDLRLAELVKRAGLRLGYHHGIEVTRLRMYDSLRGILSGWGKNFHVALGRGRALAPLLSLLILWVFCVPGPALFLAILWPAARQALPLAACTFGADLLGRLSLAVNYGVTPRGARSLGGAVVAYILCMSAYRAAIGKSVNWRGRSVGGG